MLADKMDEVLFGNFETLPLIAVKHAASEVRFHSLYFKITLTHLIQKQKLIIH